MIYKKLYFTISFILLLFLVNSCGSTKDIVYLQQLSSDALIDKTKLQENLYEARIKPKDMLSITVVATRQEASKEYNLIMPQVADLYSNNNLTTQPSLQTYLVDNDGFIDFPVFGKLKVIGMTRIELTELLKKKLAPSFNAELPIITIRFVNYSVNVIGEVARPGKYTTINDKLTIFEAISLAGDLTIYGQRNNLKVLRENADGTKSFITVNLTDENVIHSQAYYLEQNDVVYVEPNKTKSMTSRIGAAETLGISALSILISMASLVVNILN